MSKLSPGNVLKEAYQSGDRYLIAWATGFANAVYGAPHPSYTDTKLQRHYNSGVRRGAQYRDKFPQLRVKK